MTHPTGLPNKAFFSTSDPRACPSSWVEMKISLRVSSVWKFWVREPHLIPSLESHRNQGEMAHTCRGTINLASAHIDTEDSCGILLCNGARTYHLKAGSEVDRQQWITVLELAKAKAIRVMKTQSGSAHSARGVCDWCHGVPPEEVGIKSTGTAVTRKLKGVRSSSKGPRPACALPTWSGVPSTVRAGVFQGVCGWLTWAQTSFQCQGLCMPSFE